MPAKKVGRKTPAGRKTAKPLFTETVIRSINWKNVPTGTKFTGTIDRSKVSGRIFKQDSGIYLCQDSHNGATPSNTLGYKYGYCVNSGDSDDLHMQETTITTLTLDPKFKAPWEAPVINGNTVLFNKGGIRVGCTSIPNSTVRDIVKHLKD